MEMQYFKDYSPALGRDMECKIYVTIFLEPCKSVLL